MIVDLVIVFSASFLIWFMYAGLLIIWFIDGRIKKEQVIHALWATLIGFTLTETLKMIFHTVRPFLINGSQVMTLTIPSDSAFPSTHTALAFVLAMTVWLHDRRIGWIYLLLALFVGVARVLANVHYPIDIWGGAVLGTIVALSLERSHFFNFIKKLRKK